MDEKMSEEKDDVVVQEEVWGDGELGLVLKEAAANWEAEEGYKEELVAWVEDHVEDFTEYVGTPIDLCEHKIHFSDMHADYLGIFEKQITKFVSREGYSAEDFFGECKAALDDFGCALFEEHEEKWFVEVLMSATDYNEWFR
eukprot:CAMPEP_0118659190 /NCGR_PEP_ID=MMETSP0785-20121206/14976_1 /TAXON_ID=91992 /ORGANISM="Bolidomonas pacifica, Strain CCMP 1866" /LENGTH=141 /DNA_ID=CAMNT_0006552271 /DNA_START=197 /DNA_END=618 /DNA_ORIENTATION=-